MIAIINTGNVVNGAHEYRIQINKKVITTFTHNRGNGLDVCLHRAAEAVTSKILQDMQMIVEEEKND